MGFTLVEKNKRCYCELWWDTSCATWTVSYCNEHGCCKTTQWENQDKGLRVTK